MEISRFPNRLKRYRHINGYSQKKVARLLGLPDTSTISRWESGKTLPSFIQVLRLARLYITDPKDLYPELWDDIQSDQSLLAQDELDNNNESFYI